MKTDIIEDFVKANEIKNSNIKNYEDWLLASYGRTFATNFPMEYTKKYHTTTADNMATDWLGPRLYRPNIREVIYGALSLDTDDVHYVPDFRYPAKVVLLNFLIYL
jgi:protoporphyrinogen oxidase